MQVSSFDYMVARLDKQAEGEAGVRGARGGHQRAQLVALHLLHKLLALQHIQRCSVVAGFMLILKPTLMLRSVKR